MLEEEYLSSDKWNITFLGKINHFWGILEGWCSPTHVEGVVVLPL
jgi:hypothetical protein